MSKILQNVSLISHGPQAAADPCVSLYHQQQHFGYRDQDGIIWDSWYDGDGDWNVQQINGASGKTSGPPASAGPFIGVFQDQQHFAYLDNAGLIWDAWYDGQGNWKLQEINFLSSGDLPAIVDDAPGGPTPFISIWNDATNTQQHFTYLTDQFFFFDIFWDSDPPLAYEGKPYWKRQQFHDIGVRTGSGPFVGLFGDQQHVVYFETFTGSMVDHWYDGDGHWSFQRITGISGNTKGPAAMHNTRPAIWVDHSNTQQHFTYLGVDRAIYDAFWDGNSNSWNLQKLTLGGKTEGPAAWSSPTVCNYQPTGIINTVYIAYRDQMGSIWTVAYANDAWFSIKVRDLPFGSSGDFSGDLPHASGDVITWVSGNQIHFTFRGINLQGPIEPLPPVAVEARVATGTRQPGPMEPADAAPNVLRRASGVIWDFFYEPSSNEG